MIAVGMAEYKIARTPQVLMCGALGSCVAIALYDDSKKIGGLAYIMLPRQRQAVNSAKKNPAKFADSAIDILVRSMCRHGASLKNMKAKIFGGANMFSKTPLGGLRHLGARNAAAAKEALKMKKIRIVAEDLGGHHGRSVFFDTQDGSVRVKNSEESDIKC